VNKIDPKAIELLVKRERLLSTNKTKPTVSFDIFSNQSFRNLMDQQYCSGNSVDDGEILEKQKSKTQAINESQDNTICQRFNGMVSFVIRHILIGSIFYVINCLMYKHF
jgi:hypothetical protein